MVHTSPVAFQMKKAVAGDAKAQHDLAKIYWTGDCIAEDRPTAIKWYRKAAEQGHDLSALVLGNIYYKGLGATEDPAEAARWFRVAAAQGNGVIQGYAKQWLNESDPAYQDAKRREVEATARVEAEQQALHEARRVRRQKQRLVSLKNQYGSIGLVVVPIDSEIKLERPSRKKPVDKVKSNRGDNGLTYMLPPEVLLGVLAAGWVLGAIETAIESQLSSTDKEKIKDAADRLSQAFVDRVIARDLRQRILISGELPTGGSLYPAMDQTDMATDPKAIPPDIATVLEVKTSGIGLVLTEERYRPAQFLMSNELRLIRREDGVVLKEASLCYASQDTPNFSEWASDDHKRLRTELNAAYDRAAQDILLVLSEEKDTTKAHSLGSCALLKLAEERNQADLHESERR